MTDEERQRYEYERAHRAAQTAETWAVVDEAGVIHEVDVSEGRTGSPPWVAHVADGTARRSLVSARDAVVMMAQARGWSIAEVLAPGAVSRAGIERERDEARGLLNAVREALGPTCADATHAALPGLVAEVVACDAEMHREVDARGEQLRETAAKVAHLEARRGALLAEVDRLAAVVAAARDVREEASDTLRRLSLAQQRLVAARRDDRARAKVEAYDHAARIIAEETATPPARGVCSNCERHEALCVLCGRCDPACRYRDCDGCHECRPCCECGAGGAQ